MPHLFKVLDKLTQCCSVCSCYSSLSLCSAGVDITHIEMIGEILIGLLSLCIPTGGLVEALRLTKGLRQACNLWFKFASHYCQSFPLIELQNNNSANVCDVYYLPGTEMDQLCIAKLKKKASGNIEEIQAALDVVKEVVVKQTMPPSCLKQVVNTLCQYGYIFSCALTVARAACLIQFNQEAGALARLMMNGSPASGLLCYKFVCVHTLPSESIQILASSASAQWHDQTTAV